MYGERVHANGTRSDHEETDSRLSAIRGVLRAHNIELELRDDVAILSVDGTRLERPWRLAGPRDPDTDARQGGQLLLADRMPPARAAVARAHGDWYVDATGRIYVRAPGVLVDVHDSPALTARKVGRSPSSRRLLEQDPRNDRFSTSGPSSSNPMSPRRAQVVCLLLDEPRLTSASLRTLAERAGVSVGIAQQVMSDLETRRFLRHGREGLNRVDELLDQWAAAFGNGLGAKLELGRFSGDPGLGAWLRAGQSVHRSGEAASPELQGGDVTIYVERLDMHAVVGSRWNPRGERPNIVVRQRFWSEPPRVPDIYEALLPLRLADLLVTDDPRHRVAARPLREEILERHAR